MLKRLLIILTLIPIVAFSQATKKVTEEHDKPWSREVFYVLKSDKKTKHGNYQKFAYKNAIRINGYYNNGLKDSIWTEYYWGAKIKSIGKYYEDKKIGTWEYYDNKGELIQKYDYTENKLIFDREYKTQKDREFRVINGTDTIKTKLDQPPIYIGGNVMLLDLIFRNAKYPSEARENMVTGTIYITFTIDMNGITSSHRITKGIGSGCDEEALRVVKLIPDNWIPGQLNGKPVTTEYICPVIFELR
jgi:periplasmic protein TonB